MVGKIMGVLAVAAVLSAVACTDGQYARLTSLGQSGRVTCYSGGRVFFDDYSTGKIADAEHSDGYYFVSTTTRRLVHVSGQCLVDYGVDKPADFKAIHAAQ
jgi:hypothetical protein